MARKIISWLALAICEAILITAFILFRGDLSTEVMVLDMVVSTIILGLFFFDLLRPWGDQHTARMGAMGIRWSITISYAVIAIPAMILMRHSSFTIQLLVQGGLLALLLLGMAAALRTKEQIVNVYDEEKSKLNNRDDVKRAWRDLLEKVDQNGNIPSELRGRVDRMVQELRYLSPSNNTDAQTTDHQLVEGAETIGRMIGDYRMNNDQVEQKLAQCERLLQRRRTQYSN
jgi:hypothetical protein